MSGLIAEGLALAARAEAQAARRSGLVYNRPALRGWHAALADRASAPAKIVWLGDSITEGATTTARGQRWVDHALAALRTAYPTAGVVGGAGYLAVRSDAAVNGVVPPAYASLTGGAFGSDNSFGLGGRCAVLNADGDGAMFEVTCSSLAVHWVRGGGLGTLRIAIDGAEVASFSTAGALGPQVWSSAPVTSAAHSVTITRTAGGPVYVAGLTLYNGDEVKGVQGHEAGHFGWSSANLASGALAFMWEAVGAVAPSLVTIAIGTNDYQAQVPIASFRANLASVIASVRAQAAQASIALIAYGRRGDVALPQTIGWPDYVDAMYALADAENLAMIDLSQRLPDAAMTGAADPLGLYTGDRVHFAARGHALIGEMVAGALRA